KELIDAYLISMMAQDLFTPPENLEKAAELFKKDTEIIGLLEETHYLNGRHPVPKQGNLNLAWEYSKNPEDHHQFIQMLRVSPLVFQVLLELIEDHPVFQNGSNNSQTPVEHQLAVTLF
ncbi:hypothetical protein BYT27DRAFT_7111618, partial [Phlegmacium glaucopus]